MTDKPWHAPGLPKWPAIVIAGDPVTQKQASEIIVRTSGLSFFTNDKDWERQINEELGFSSSYDWEKEQERREELGVLDLEYLTTSRIASAYIHGPGGWIDWDGRVAYSGHNIGKWPSCGVVHRELALIAAAWPFLVMRVQLFREKAESATLPIVQYLVHDGNVIMGPPTGEPLPITRPDVHQSIDNLFHSARRERGCSIERFREAIEVTRAAMACHRKGETPSA